MKDDVSSFLCEVVCLFTEQEKISVFCAFFLLLKIEN